MEKPSIICISGHEVPLWCDIYVLSELQDKYETVGAFERKLIGLEEVGDQVVKKEKDIRAITDALRLMIKEGYKKLEAMGEPVEPVDIEQLVMEVDISFSELSDILHNVFRRCFASKK